MQFVDTFWIIIWN